MSDKFTMVGTERSGQYVGLAADLGQVGYRDLGGGSFRVRIEPAGQEALDKLSPAFPSSEYKQPGCGGNRFSCVVAGEVRLREVVKHALAAVLAEGSVRDSEKAPRLMLDLLGELGLTGGAPGDSTALPVAEPGKLSREQLVVQARSLGIKGVNGRWSEATLLAKIAAAGQPAESEEPERSRLIAQLRASKVPGANGASRWSLDTLRSKARLNA